MEPRVLLTYPKVRSNPAKAMRNQIVLLKMTARTLRCLMPVLCLTAGLASQNGDQANSSVSPSVVHARAILGFEGISNNTNGELSIQGDNLIFKPAEGPIARIPLASIQGLFLSQEDKEVGGTPLAVGRAVTPFGGGRAIGLFAHKKFDFLTLEYLEPNGGFHGAICQLDKGQGQAFGSELETKGVHVSGQNNDSSKLETKK
jgi:hypothetical protein